MTSVALERLAGLVTEPYRRGAETLDLPLAEEAGGVVEIPAYDFREYEARHGSEPPSPRYVLIAVEGTGRDPVTVEVDHTDGGPEEVATVNLPAEARPGASFAIPLPAGAGPETRLVRLRRLGPGPSAWRVLALLGELAKLLWVVGAEKDEVHATLAEVRSQRFLASARAASLDLLGADLRVPRFPPRQYSFDPDTVALYHLNEHPVADGGAVADETGRFGLPGHPAVNQGAASGARGKIGGGFALPAGSGTGHLRIPHDADFNAPAGRSFTVELFLRLEPSGADGARAVAVKGTLGAEGDLTGNGWALVTGPFRGVPDNLRWAGRSAAGSFEVYADLGLADDRFHHLAGVVDRDAGRARLFVDGVERGSADVGGLGAFSNAQAVRIGRSGAGHQLAGVVDEVRVSRTARTDFDPVLGEGDEAYRRRLAIFERWLLPTPGALRDAIHDAVSLPGEDEPFVLVEGDRPIAAASRAVRVVPVSLEVGRHMDRDGDVTTSAAQVCGTAADEASFRPELLLRQDAAGIAYAGEAARRMQLVAALPLEALAELVADEAPGGELRVERAFDSAPGEAAREAAGEDLHRVGRALELRHTALGSGDLAALAHRAGFDFVEARAQEVFAAVAPGPQLEVVVAPVGAPVAGADLFPGEALDLQTRPGELPAGGRYEWTIVRCGLGRARFEPHPDDPPGPPPRLENRRRLRLVAEVPGEVTVSVEYRLHGVTATGSRPLRIAPETLADGESVAADGDGDAALDAAVGPPEEGFDPRYLVEHASGVAFAAGVDARMQIAVDRRLEGVIGLLGPGADLTRLRVLRAFDPADAGLHGVGRAVLLEHLDLPAGRLASLAHRSGFGWVERRGSEVFCAEAPGPKAEIVRAADGAELPAELPVGAPVPLALRPAALEGQGQFDWSLEPMGREGRGRGLLAPVLRRESTFTPERPGLVAINALFVEDAVGATAPYTFELRLRPELDVPDTIIPKDQYDLVMNLLSHFHPVGVEVLTRNLREHVVEVRDDLLNAFPGYTYPEFRA